MFLRVLLSYATHVVMVCPSSIPAGTLRSYHRSSISIGHFQNNVSVGSLSYHLYSVICVINNLHVAKKIFYMF